MLFLFAADAAGAVMSRVVRVIDGGTVVIEDRGVQRSVRLAGVEVPAGYSADAVGFAHLAADALTRAVTGRWVMIEDDPAGGAYLYRSPDAWFVNREMIRGGFALMAHMPVSRSSELLDAERFARAQGAGYWSASGAGQSLEASGHMTYLGIGAPGSPPRATAKAPRPTRRAAVYRARPRRVGVSGRSPIP